MTLDETLADLQYQAARLAGHFAAISDRVEAEGARAAVVAASALAEPPARAGHWDHVHSGYAGEPELSAPVPVRQDTPVGVVAAVDGSVLNFEGENYVPQTPQGAAPSGATQGVPAPGAVEVEGEAATPAVAPPPAAPVAPAPAAAEAAPPAEEAPKKRSRRTLEEIAADNGVTLDEVKAWLGPDRKATKATIEEYVAATQAAAPQVVEPSPEPAPAAAPAPAPMPTTVANPFGQGAQLPPAAAPQPEPAVAPPPQPQYAPPAPQAPAPVAAPDFGQGTETIADWNPFQS